MKLCFILAGMALAVHAAPALPQTSVATSTVPIVVTATRTARTADETLASVTVITREDIERRQAQDIADLLRTQAGIDVTRSGGPSGNVSLFLRGTNSNHVLVLIDGIRVESVTTGTFEWRSLPLAQIERIEIVRGPRAALYGSDAIGGVIQIFTRRAKGAEVALGAGSDHTRRADAAWGASGRTHVFLAGSHFATDGFSAQNSRGFSFNPDNDGSRVQGISAGVHSDLGRGASFEVLGRQTRADAEFDEGTQDVANGSLLARLSHSMTSAWVQTLSVGALSDELVTRQISTSRIHTKRRTIDWQNDITLGAASTLTAGLAYVEESGINASVSTGSTVFDRNQTNRAAFTLWQSRVGANDFQLAARYDKYSTVGGHETWSAAYGWALDEATRTWVSYGTAFHAPTFNQLYHPGCCGGLFAGNPNLKPERSRTAEFGLRRSWEHGHTASLALFSTNADDLIEFAGTLNQAININKSNMRGIEFEHGYAAGPWHASSAVTLQRARDETSGAPLLRRADRKLSAFVERRLGRGAMGVELVAVSERPDRDALGNVITVSGYGVVNLAGRYSLHKSLSLEGRIENLFDKEYQVIEGFNTPDRSLFFTLSYQPTTQP